MPINIPGLLVPFHLLINPGLVLPGLAVRDIRQIDFVALHEAGYRGAVFDKDNCLTRPYRDTLIPDLQEAWDQCRSVFGEGNVLIVSNSAGTRHDVGYIQSASVSKHLKVPVLHHHSLKPSYACIASIRDYFTSLPMPVRDDQLVMVGDRILTDVVMANRMKRGSISSPAQFREKYNSRGPLAIWTTEVWERDSTFVRWFEKTLCTAVQRFGVRYYGMIS